MKIQLLPSTIETDGTAAKRQHFSCIVIDNRVAIDAGSLAFACSDVQRAQVRDVIISHVHLDHIAGLPPFIDDLYSTLTGPVRIHGTAGMIDALETHIFNWTIYPRFSELTNVHGRVLEYETFVGGREFSCQHLSVTPIAVNHVPESMGFIISDGSVSIGITGDTAHTDEVWEIFSDREDLAAVFVECAFPNKLASLAKASHHLTPAGLADELKKFKRGDVPIFVVNIKPTFRQRVIDELSQIAINGLTVAEPGHTFQF
jgi:cAMP phosphodiesterase